MEAALGVYRPRHPQKTPFYRCLEDYWEEFQRGYEALFESVYGPLRGAVTRAVERFRKCGILHYGFARLKCQGCGRNRFLAYSCRTRQFCPSCAAKRVAAFTDWVASEVLEPVSHRQVVFTIPNVPDAVWTRDGRGLPISYLDPDAMTRIFQAKVLARLVDEQGLSPELAARLLTWRHRGFQVYRAESVEPDDRRALERLCAYIGRAVFASSRVEYDPSSGAVPYQTAKGAQLSLDALEWIALVTQHVPDPGEHTRHYFGHYSNAARGKRRQIAAVGATDTATELPPAGPETDEFRRECRRSWARLIQKVYEVDPLVCPDCGGRLEVVAFIDATQTICKILEPLGLWALPARPPPAPLLQGKIDALTARSCGNRSAPAAPSLSSGTLIEGFIQTIPTPPLLSPAFCLFPASVFPCSPP